jgi:hypothetical protein
LIILIIPDIGKKSVVATQSNFELIPLDITDFALVCRLNRILRPYISATVGLAGLYYLGYVINPTCFPFSSECLSLGMGPSPKKDAKYVILPGAIARQPWDAFEEVGFRTSLSIPKKREVGIERRYDKICA